MRIRNLFGKSKIFHLEKEFLISTVRPDLINALIRLGRSDKDINEYLIAFDYFVENPKKYDGATIVRDLYIIRYRLFGTIFKLDPDAMLHDYEYIMKRANRNFIRKIVSDYKYFMNMLKNGKGLQLTRFILLNLLTLTVVYVLHNHFKYKQLKK